jgi:hypothetical protein
VREQIIAQIAAVPSLPQAARSVTRRGRSRLKQHFPLAMLVPNAALAPTTT